MLKRFLSTRRLWEQGYIDLWSIPHTLFGVLVAFLVPLTLSGFWIGLSITVVVAIVWELIERVTGLAAEEAISNSITDIAVAAAGFTLASLVLSALPDPRIRDAAFAVLAVIWICTETLGWVAYRHYSSRKA